MDTVIIIGAVIINAYYMLHKPRIRLPLITQFHVITRWKFYRTERY